MARPTGDSGKLWLALLKEGGRKSAREAADLTSHYDTTVAGSLLKSMEKCGSVRKFPVTPGSRNIKYGVTLQCRVPIGVTIGEILDCNLTGEQDE